MLTVSEIDAYLSAATRSLRSDETAPWPVSVGWNEPPKDQINAIWDRIEFHGIALLLHSQLVSLENWPGELIARLTEESRIIGLWETTHQRAIANLIKAWTDAGIESLVMKGTALAYSLHADPAMRRRGDTDILINPEDLENSREVLIELGWKPKDSPHGLNCQESWLLQSAREFLHLVDLHWQPVDRPVLQKVFHFDDFMTNKVALPRLSSDAYRTDNSQTFLHCALNQKWHLSRGYWADAGLIKDRRRLIWSIDFDLLLGAFTSEDWESLFEKAERAQIGFLVRETLEGLSDDIGAQPPESLNERIEQIGNDQFLKTYLETADTLAEFWSDLRSLNSFGEQLRFLMVRAMPPRDHLLSKYPSASRWPTLLLRARMILSTAGRAVTQVATGTTAK